VAFVVKRQGSSLDESSLKRFALRTACLSIHARSGLSTAFLASTNKLDRNSLRELAAKAAEERLDHTARGRSGQ